MSFSILAPDPFNFDCPEQWPNWIRRFERYRLASKLSNEDDKNQENTLMFLLGDKVDDILLFQLTVEQAANYNTVKTKFDVYFAIRKNVIYERAVFNKRVQLPNELLSDPVCSLVIKYCENE